MKCLHCNREILGEAWIIPEGGVHINCLEEYERVKNNLCYECPKCKKTGLIDDPSGEKTFKWVHLSPEETPMCAWNGCPGCKECRERVKTVSVTVRIKCDLCDGVGYLTKEPKPIKNVVDWVVE